MTDSKDEQQKKAWHYHAARMQEASTFEDSIVDANINYGAGCCYFIPAYRGKSNIDPEEFAKYLETVASGADPNLKYNVTNPIDIKFQDKVLPGNYDDGPDNELASELVNEIMTATANWTGERVFPSALPWTIVHGHQWQTYPHAHIDQDADKKSNYWAVVYWARVPKNSGLLELYPSGFGSEISATTFIIPKAGDFFVFPANLLHGVRQNLSDELRVSMSFNMRTMSMETLLDGAETL